MSVHDEYQKAVAAAATIKDMERRMSYLANLAAAYTIYLNGEAAVRYYRELERIRRLPTITVAM
ncbi:hypothetical protein [Xanthomonas campestris]|uniref:hypothetical protein n=1 Tax=Xanthomonas campestris TaxID=339 RepID=UPI0023689028|nr:hypothetical protein [Xanthomonas campestris]WDI91941.1 hypothetical protein JH280_11385 [Xanthomonas campestris]